MRVIVLSFVFCTLLFVGCEKIGVDPNAPTEPPTPVDDPRFKFKGVYNMTKLENGQQYVMEIDTLGGSCSGSGCSFIIFENFGDLFDFDQIFYSMNPENQLQIVPQIPLLDKQGYRWKVSSEWGTSCNAIYGDSIKICFKINNILYYAEDGVSYQELILTHVGERQ